MGANEGEQIEEIGINRLRWRYFSQTILPFKYAVWKTFQFVRTFLLAYLVVLAGQLAMCAIEFDTEKEMRADRIRLQQRLKAELSNETYGLLVTSGFGEVKESDPYAWDFRGRDHSRSLMFSFTTVASIGYGDVSPNTASGQVFCILFTVFATPALVVTYLFAARKTLNFVHLLVLILDETNIRTFHQYDRDGSGQLDTPEFTAALVDLGYPVLQEDVTLIMEEVNICDSDLITIEEFGHAMELLEFPDAKYQKARRTAVMVVIVALVWLFVGTFCFMWVESWGFIASMWFCWETSMTIGLGDIIPQTEAGRWLNMVYSFIGLGHLSLLLQTFVDLLTKHSSIVGRLEKKFLEGNASTPTVRDVKEVRTKAKKAEKRIGALKAVRAARSQLFTKSSSKEVGASTSTCTLSVTKKDSGLENFDLEDMPSEADHNVSRMSPQVFKSPRD